ncbi:HAD family hydrolase [Rossellomorea vietnamensis]|uniref:D,D-heptose 1,7-bisphosphate phosphatase n=1 Tax=Rossellomorea vietnamensis TaxID=218284 RepID=A0A5D4K9F6_9BACI|nr:HAD family hydrolase [Rossellomorea vietnamensis]TYR74024.1 HAD family hydrolase [Rossellomorea vietnamensis]
MKKAVFLDRDGVINEVLSKRVKFVNKLSDIYYLEKVPEAVRLLNEAEYKIFVVTNQGGVGLGYLTSSNLDRIHEKMKLDIEKQGGVIEEFSSCIHKPHEGCSCRKPEAGLLFELAEKHEIDLSQSYMVGDREPDIEAGKKAGCTTILIADKDTEKIADYHFPSLYSAAKWISSRKQA